MPLSADGILGFFDGKSRSYETFEHVSLAVEAPLVSSPTTTPTTATLLSRHLHGAPVPEANAAYTTNTSSNGSNNINAAWVTPNATAVPQWSTASWATELKGTLYICSLPEMMWYRIASVTATSAPSQRQLAFSSEAPAFCRSTNQSFALEGRDAPCSPAHNTKLPPWEKEDQGSSADGRHSGRGKHGRNIHLVEEELPEVSAFGHTDDAVDNTDTPPQRSQTAHRHLDPTSTTDPRDRLYSLDQTKALSAHPHWVGGDGADSAEENEGIQLPGTMPNMRSPVLSSAYRSGSSIVHSAAVCSQAQQKTSQQAGPLNAYQKIGSPQSPPLPTTTTTPVTVTTAPRTVECRNLPIPAPAIEATPAAGTVTVLLWVAADASLPRVGEVEDNRATVSPVRQLLSSPLKTDPRWLHLRSNSGTAGGGYTTRKATDNVSSSSGIAMTETADPSLPACLCVCVRDIAKVESCDTDVTTTRERRVQRVTVMLESGATVYTAKSTSDAFECAVKVNASLSATSKNANRTSLSLSGSACGSCFRTLPSGELSCSFIFYQGGITRCVASLRKYSSKLVFTCLGARHNNTNSSGSVMMASEGSRAPSGAGRGGVSSDQFSPTEFGTGEVNGSSLALPAGGLRNFLNAPWKSVEGPLASGVPLMPSPTPQGSEQPRLQQGTKPTGGGWKARLSPVGLFRQSKYAVAASDPAHSPLRSASTTSFFTSGACTAPTKAPLAGAVRGVVVGVGELAGEENGVGKQRRSGPQRAPLDGENAGGYSSTSSFEDLTDELTSVRLGADYTAPMPPKPSLPPVAPGASNKLVTAAEWEAVFDAAPPGASAATTVNEGVTLNKGKVLNADRWRAFRQSLFKRGGLADSSIRHEVWCYLLGAYPIGSKHDAQKAVLAKEKELYTLLTTQWKSFLPEQEEHFAVYRYAKHSIKKDVERTDRTHPAFRDDDSDMLRALQGLLLAHVMYNMDLGYSQGMSDVAAIALLVAPPSEEAAVFLCLRKMLSEHMADNFVIEERKKDAPYAAVKGLQRKLYQVQVLTRHFHPRLYGHLKMRCVAEDMTFCFRWLLVCFKRDLPSLDDTMRFWDVLFACPYTKSYEVIVTVALLVALAPQVIAHIHSYEVLLQFMNALSSGTSVEQILQCAREFYEDVCVIETRELWRRHQPAVAHASTDRDRFPTVEEMVLLFLETDGPL
ncbi:hypothetical protein ABL78_7403 [Leptomonas seymouri]|uniref:Rab-GAP TBC domain-containing protein n=1 Tax=Leptomonas seymouri TaxID=5684 RepID=A0A0N1PCE3_LEPSE|nr:hypothetical protein ABL78_7403 [Leptomonas seymouri]|eukprot:KPI83564.1 hypothetical protein ABL78_7403 [Leptomonas seymouri]